MIADNKVAVFFYGSYMNFDFLVNLGISQRTYHVAQLPGYALTIGSAANVVKHGLAQVFGIVTQLTYDELETLYSRQAQAKLGAHYMPEPVVVMTADGNIVPSLCYIAYDEVGGVPSAAYIDTILSAARQYEFPKYYIDHIKSYV